jgi:hypothetical protein
MCVSNNKQEQRYKGRGGGGEREFGCGGRRCPHETNTANRSNRAVVRLLLVDASSVVVSLGDGRRNNRTILAMRRKCEEVDVVDFE